MPSICMLVQNYYDFDIRVRRKAEALVKAGYSVDVFALRGNRSDKAYALNGVNVCTVALGKKRGSLARYAFEYAAFFLWALVRVTAAMRRQRYAIVDVNTLPDFLVFAAAFAKWMGAKVILDMHEITPEFYMSKYGIRENSLCVSLLRLQERLSFAFADHVITINEPIQDLLASRGLAYTKSTVITNSADETRFIAFRNGVTGKETRGASFVMMYHGTLTKLYGLDLAIDAFAIAHQRMPGAELWILGDGPEATSLRLLAEKRGLTTKVKLLGVVSPSDIPAWLDKSDIGLLPIRRDVFLEYASPNKLAEYIIMGKPVAISRLRAIRHYFSETAFAYFDPSNIIDFANQMLRLYESTGLRRQLAHRATKEYAPIRWDIMKERYIRLIADIACLSHRAAPAS